MTLCSARTANSGELAAAEFRSGDQLRRPISNPHPRPFDGDTKVIRDHEPSQFSSIPVSAVGFAKEPSVFSVFNPLSRSIQKYFQFGPVFSI